ncbi:MAG: DMT family transporter [Gemmatimonadales bacterium]|nr:MAG: DMT family transporter [Gemmatimonadales bacterium]
MLQDAHSSPWKGRPAKSSHSPGRMIASPTTSATKSARSFPSRAFFPRSGPGMKDVSPVSRPPVPPALALGVSVLAFSWAGPLVRFTEAPALAISLWRLLIAVGILAVVVSLRREGWGPLRKLPPRAWALGSLAGGLLALHFWSWIASVQYTSIASSVVLVSTQPLCVALLSALFLREHPRRREWVGLMIAVVGAAWIGLGDLAIGGTALLGDALALSAAVLAAAYYIVGRALRPHVDIWSYVLLVYGTAALVLLAAVLLHPGVALVEGYERRDWWVFLALALGPMLLGHTGVNYALRYVRAYIANLAVLGEPIGATVIAWLLPAIAERPPLPTLIGGGLILLGIAVALQGGRPSRDGSPQERPGGG